MYDLVVRIFSVPPSEYWQMSPDEVNILIEGNRPKHVGGIHEDELEALHLRRQELINQGVKLV